MNQFFKVNRLWQKEFGSQTGKNTHYHIKGLKENTRSEAGLVALITGLNTTQLDSRDTPQENTDWLTLITENIKQGSNNKELEAEKESDIIMFRNISDGLVSEDPNLM